MRETQIQRQISGDFGMTCLRGDCECETGSRVVIFCAFAAAAASAAAAEQPLVPGTLIHSLPHVPDDGQTASTTISILCETAS